MNDPRHDVAVATPPPACPRCGGAPAGAPEPSTGFVACAGCGSRFDPRAPGTRVGATPEPLPEVVFKRGVMIGDYELLRELGRGGMSTVWAARQARLDRPVAVKVLHPHLALDADLRRRFLREAEALVHLDHPGIVPAIDRGEHAGRPYLVVAYAGERTLRDELVGPDRNPRRLSPMRVAAVARAVLLALAHAHARGLVHRDIKPENLLVGDDGAVRVADFGIAQLDHGLDGRTLTRLTGIGTVLGTIGYMAPEQAAGGLALDARADLYAVGVLCYEALAGHLPVGRFEEPAHLLTDLPEARRQAWNRFVLALLERSPNRRPADAAAALKLLDAIGSGSADDVRPASGLDRAVVEIDRAIGRLDRAVSTHTGDRVRVREAVVGIGERSRAAAMQVRDWWGARVDPRAHPDAHRLLLHPHGRILMRPRQGRTAFGVCAGLGAWSGVHPAWWAVAFIVAALSTLGTAALAYVVLAIVLPECDGPYRPLPLNHRLPPRPSGAWLGVCALLGDSTGVSAGIWRLIAVIGTLCFGATFVAYVIAGIILPRATPPGSSPMPVALAAPAPAAVADGLRPSWAHKRFALMVALALAVAAWVVDARSDLWRGDHTAIGASVGWSSQPIEPALWWAAIVVGLTSLVMAHRRVAPEARPAGALAGLVAAGGVLAAVGLSFGISRSPLGGQQVGEAMTLVGATLAGAATLIGACVGRAAPVRWAIATGLGLCGALAIDEFARPRHDALTTLSWVAASWMLALAVVRIAGSAVRGGVFATRVLGFAAVVGCAFAVAVLLDGGAAAGMQRLEPPWRASVETVARSPHLMLAWAAAGVALVVILAGMRGDGERAPVGASAVGGADATPLAQVVRGSDGRGAGWALVVMAVVIIAVVAAALAMAG